MRVHHTILKPAVLALCVAGLLCASASAQAEQFPGQVMSFGNNGVARSAALQANTWPSSLAAGTGRIIGSADFWSGDQKRTTIAVTAFDNSGRPTNGFGSRGVARYKVSALAQTLATAIDARGRVVILFAAARTGTFFESSLELARLRADGSVDPGFNGGNPLLIDGGDTYGGASLTVTPAGRIFVYNATMNNEQRLFSVNDAGQLDPTYGTQGHVNMDVQAPLPPWNADFDVVGVEWRFGAVADDGSVFMMTTRANGRVNYPGVGKVRSFLPWILKLDPTGRPDPTFGSNGSLAIKRPEPDGYAVAVGAAKDGGFAAVVVTERPLPPKGKKSRPGAVLQHFGPTGASRPATSSGRKSIALPPFKLKKGIGGLYSFNRNGSFGRLAWDERKYEFSRLNPNGTRVRRHKIVTLPKVFLHFDPAIVDPTDSSSFLVGGGIGKRFAVVKVRPTR